MSSDEGSVHYAQKGWEMLNPSGYEISSSGVSFENGYECLDSITGCESFDQLSDYHFSR
jgi:hypothetical protein